MHEKYQDLIAPVVAEHWAKTPAKGSNVPTQKDPNGPFHAEIAREMFAALPSDEREDYAKRAKAEALEAHEKYEAAMKDAPSKTPEDRQA
jgi:hypothetical protein